ncbi:hypothetical protein DPMN_010656 [Dreissena polymorpha]|uniref:Uncharacterized protein n=1 Tax=Dreissena polymorpha TaxID=45954 RepID=A0A9D4N3K7_DREPO|nr:hypothetical protein DPMN_010656 [Dreissena polymorpha]
MELSVIKSPGLVVTMPGSGGLTSLRIRATWSSTPTGAQELRRYTRQILHCC